MVSGFAFNDDDFSKPWEGWKTNLERYIFPNTAVAEENVSYCPFLGSIFLCFSVITNRFWLTITRNFIYDITSQITQ
jgi:hypothetical protein